MQASARWACVLTLALVVAGCKTARDATVPPGVSDAATTTTTAAGADAASQSPVGQADSASPVAEAAALVNGEPVPLEEFRRIALSTQSFYVEQGLDPNTADGQEQLRAIRRAILDDLIDQKLIEQAARELGIVVTDQEVQESLNKTIASAGGEEAFRELLAKEDLDLAAALAMERASLVSQRVFEKVIPVVSETAEFVHARHIQCETLTACQNAVARLVAGEAFDAVARELSVDTLTRDNGGDLGWVGRGTMPSRLAEEAIFALADGQLSDIVQTEYGYHVFEVLERDPQRPIDEEQRLSIWEAETLRWLADRRAQAVIEILIEELRVTPAAAWPEVPAASTPLSTTP